MDERAKFAFAEIIGDGEQTVLLLDAGGGVTAGMYIDSTGREVSAEVGAALGAIGAEASRAMRHPTLAGWRAISRERTEANPGTAPPGGDAVVLVPASPAVPMGFVRRLLEHAAVRALAWREEVA